MPHNASDKSSHARQKIFDRHLTTWHHDGTLGYGFPSGKRGPNVWEKQTYGWESKILTLSRLSEEDTKLAGNLQLKPFSQLPHLSHLNFVVAVGSHRGKALLQCYNCQKLHTRKMLRKPQLCLMRTSASYLQMSKERHRRTAKMRKLRWSPHSQLQRVCIHLLKKTNKR